MNLIKRLLIATLIVLGISGCSLGKSGNERYYRKNIIGTWKDPEVTGSGFRFGRCKMENLDSALIYGTKFKYRIIGDTLVIFLNKDLTSKSKIVSLKHDTLILMESPNIKTVYIK